MILILPKRKNKEFYYWKIARCHFKNNTMFPEKTLFINEKGTNIKLLYLKNTNDLIDYVEKNNYYKRGQGYLCNVRKTIDIRDFKERIDILILNLKFEIIALSANQYQDFQYKSSEYFITIILKFGTIRYFKIKIGDVIQLKKI